jgi:carboxyl-terminal processing protease
MKSYTVYMWVVVLLSMILGFLIGSNQQIVQNVLRKPVTGNQKLSQFMRYLDQYYVDQIDTDSLATEVIQDLIQKLDPHSFYISKEELSSMAENMQGNFKGIGVSFFMVNDTVNVLRVLPGGPSKSAGILAGDRILIANQDTLYGKQLQSQDIVNILRGEENTPIELSLFRPRGQKNILVELNRGAIPITSVSHYLTQPEIGYIKINRFAETTSREFSQAITDLKNKGMIQLILDLRNNPGGYLEAAEQIADIFLAEGKAIVMVQSNKGEQKVTYATKGGAFEKGQVYVLINGESASASEVVAGALQDNDRAWILGQRSFGKGLVQQQMPLGAKEAVRLTTARYYTPTGRSIQRSYEKGNEAYYDEIQERFHTGEMADANKIPHNDSLAFTTPKGRVVYGGGGIVPDIYMANKASIEQEWSNYLLKSNLINHFVFTELDQRREAYRGVDRETFIKSPIADQDRWITALKSYIKTEGIPLQLEDETLAAITIQSYLGLQLFDEAAQLKILHRQDEFVLKALEEIKKKPLD